jgi:hypothetical protein
VNLLFSTAGSEGAAVFRRYRRRKDAGIEEDEKAGQMVVARY